MIFNRKTLGLLLILGGILQGRLGHADQVCTTILDAQGRVVEQLCEESRSQSSTSQSSERLIPGSQGRILEEETSAESTSCQLRGFDPSNMMAPYQFSCRDQDGLVVRFHCADPQGDICTQEGEIDFDTVTL